MYLHLFHFEKNQEEHHILNFFLNKLKFIKKLIMQLSDLSHFQAIAYKCRYLNIYNILFHSSES